MPIWKRRLVKADISNRKVLKYDLGGETDTKLLRFAYLARPRRKPFTQGKRRRRNREACPTTLFAPSDTMLLRAKIWAQKDMDADHVTAWSKGGGTDIGNCQMLCESHNRAKGNK
ncbi:MAG: HNH endonuclease [Clostridiales bacterium]|nr:HNH endonuclease [Clostridiales bacterium]